MQGLEARRDGGVLPDDHPIVRLAGGHVVVGPGFALNRRTGVVFVAEGLSEDAEAHAVGSALTYHLCLADEFPMVFPVRLADYPIPSLPAAAELN
jgi:hypothetical protein